jgi:hypothetical protein
LDNIKAVADFWCAGDCTKAQALPDGLFATIYFHVSTKAEGRAIEAEEAAREQRRKAKFNGLLS